MDKSKVACFYGPRCIRHVVFLALQATLRDYIIFRNLQWILLSLSCAVLKNIYYTHSLCIIVA